MLTYQVKKNDTIAGVTRQFNTNWATLRKNNPDAIGQSSKNGNWFLKEGATVTLDGSFQHSLQQAEQKHNAELTPPQPITIPQTQHTTSFTDHQVQEIDHQHSQKDQQATQSHVIEHTLQAGETIWELAVKKYHVHVKDIIADNSISDPKTLQVGQKLNIRLPESIEAQPVVASWYGKDYHGKPMANGDIYDMNAATIAHKELPFGTTVELENTATGEMVQAVVTDRGPYIEGRDVDLSYGLARKLSLVEQGVGSLVMRIL